MLKMMPMMRAMRRYGKISIQDYASRFSDPFLRQAFPLILDDLPDFPMTALLFALAELHRHNAGWPIGGSLEFTRAIERRYLDLGGEIHYKSRVAKILVEDDQAVGVCLVDGTEHSADMIISAADGRTTIYDMLEGKYTNFPGISGYSVHIYSTRALLGLSPILAIILTKSRYLSRGKR